MLKNVIAPIQAWLLSRGQCVGCGMPLSKAEHKPAGEGQELVTCKCGRVFMYGTTTQKYRRALVEEAK